MIFSMIKSMFSSRSTFIPTHSIMRVVDVRGDDIYIDELEFSKEPCPEFRVLSAFIIDVDGDILYLSKSYIEDNINGSVPVMTQVLEHFDHGKET